MFPLRDYTSASRKLTLALCGASRLMFLAAMNIPAVSRLVFRVCFAAAVILSSALHSAAATNDPSDPYLWLEDVTGEKAIAWGREQNALSQRELEAAPDFNTNRQRLLAILDSKERIPGVAKYGRFYYNFWQDAKKSPRPLASHDARG